jgi:3-oxoacyl-[acyl-carrier-protein] synthase-3
MQMREIGALDIRNQCSGFLYALSVADQFIKSGMYKNILVVGSEKHSFGLDFTTRGRNISVIFGDGAGAVVLQATDEPGTGILSTHLHSDGNSAELLAMYNPGTHANHWADKNYAHFDQAEIGQMFMSHQMIDEAQNYPYMDGQSVFKKAVVKFPEVIMEALNKNGLTPADIHLLIPHQANLRILEATAKRFGLDRNKLIVTVDQHANTSAASVPLALDCAIRDGRVKPGHKIMLQGVGGGFTWGAALVQM